MLGSYSQCITLKVPKDITFKSSYIRLDFQVISAILKEYFDKTTTINIVPSFGMCLPDTCSKWEIKEIFTKVYRWKSFPIKPSKVFSYNTIELDTKAWILLLALTSMIIVIAVATLLDILALNSPMKDDQSSESEFLLEEKKDKNSNILNKILEISTCFSFVRNLEKLSLAEPSKDISCIHGIRFFSMCWIILIHTRYDLTALFANPTYLKEWNIGFLSNISYSVVAVHSFFVLSGFLVTISTLKKLSDSSFKIVPYYIHRYWRITPTYAIIMATYIILYQFFVKGPMSVEENSFLEICNKGWWMNLLYINNINNISCMGWTWYLAADMQFYVLAPMLIYSLYRWKYFGIIFNLLTIIAACITSAIISYQYDFPSSNFFIKEKKLDLFTRLYYETPWTNIGSYVVGILTGWKFFTDGKLQLNKITIRIISTAAVLISLLIIFFPINTLNVKFTNAIFNSLHKPLWSICISWLILFCLTIQKGIVHDLLSLRMWIVPSRLTFVAYLVHPIIISAFVNSRENLIIMDSSLVIFFFLMFLTASFLLAFFITVTVEIPLRNVAKYTPLLKL
ncbi:DgyrCDS13260 [Dimorphilus gyrociliatus]|uniref:DgyrCDS13260 n=1 Tax=Dimorphilus gyrociliatus TaxID=2664684 RepID=A0A7I8WA51_9ANNE|nr:DgyrCDS13260 [Dimorphilus gyrociliatus]